MSSTKNVIAPARNGNSQPGLSEIKVSISNITTIVDAYVNQQVAVTRTLELLKQTGCLFTQQLDWITLSPHNKWISIEVKFKSRLYHPPPFWGIGLDLSQVYLRNQILKSLSIPCFLIAYVEEQPYGQYLDVLDKGDKHRTENDILVFPVEAFYKGEDAIIQALKGGLDD